MAARPARHRDPPARLAWGPASAKDQQAHHRPGPAGLGLKGGARNVLAVRLALDELAQAVVVLVAGGAALEVGPHARDPGVSLRALELELDVLVEPLEALVAEQLRPGGAEQPLQAVVVSVLVHDLSPL